MVGALSRLARIELKLLSFRRASGATLSVTADSPTVRTDHAAAGHEPQGGLAMRGQGHGANEPERMAVVRAAAVTAC